MPSRRERVFGEESDEFAESLTSRGEATCYLGRHEAAVALARRALAVRESLGADAGAGLAATLRLLGRALTESGRAGEAVTVLERAVAVCRAAKDEDGASTAEAMARLAYAQWRAGDLRSARRSYEYADRIWASAATGPDREQAAALRWWGGLLCEAGAFAAAEAVLDRAVRMARGLYGSDHVETVRAEEARGVLLARTGRAAEGNACNGAHCGSWRSRIPCLSSSRAR